MNITPLPPVGATVIVHDRSHDVECVVTESPMQHGIGFGDALLYDESRRICVLGIAEPTYRIGGIIARNEDRYGALITWSLP